MDPISIQLLRKSEDSLPSWLSVIGGTGDDGPAKMAIDSSNNVYLIGSTTSQGSGSYDAYIVKYDANLSIQWQRALGGSGFETGYSIALDSNGYIYITGQPGFIAQYNPSGTLQWQRVLSGVTAFRGIAVDSSNNIYISGMYSSGGAVIAKYNSSGILQWQKLIAEVGYSAGRDIAVDSSGYLYVCSGYELILHKLDASGALQWGRNVSSMFSDYRRITCDSSGNSYTVSPSLRNIGNGLRYFLSLAKYNTSGTLQWSRVIDQDGWTGGNGVSVDSNGNVYVIGSTSNQGAGSNDILIAKYNSSGVIQWQRLLGGTGNDGDTSSEKFYGSIVAGTNGSIYIASTTQSVGTVGSNNILVAKLSADGSGTGTYGSLTYAVSTLPEANAGATDSVNTMTISTSSYTESAGSYTSTVTTL